MAAIPAARAQLNPHVGYVYPAGGRQGASLRVTVGGQNLVGPTNNFFPPVYGVHVSGTGVDARIVEVTRPMTTQEAISMRDQLQEMMGRRTATFRPKGGFGGRFGGMTSTNATWTSADEQSFEALRKKLGNFVPPNQLVPAIADTVTLQVTIAPDAEPGGRELRLGTAFGLSNPLRFHVGQLPEFAEPLAKILPAPINSTPEQRPRAAKSAMNITLPAVVNGQIMPGGVDQFRFRASKGQRLVLFAQARELVPYLPDAVPGWFEAKLTLCDARGKELACSDDFRFHPDPVIYFEIPADGEYAVEIRDSVYRGRQDFVYRMTLGELPFVTSIFPLGGPVGAQTAVELRGWNLPANSLTPAAVKPGINRLSVNKGGLMSNLVPFAGGELPERLEQEPNDQRGGLQPVTLPVIINGRIDAPGDTDVFCWAGRAGDQVVAEVDARRLGSPLDSALRLTDATGRQLAYSDDHEDIGSGLNTHHADSRLTFTLPADGTYCVRLTDAQHKGGPEHAYRLRLSPPRPDFALRVVPSSISVRGNRSVPITIYALRQDGLAGEIVLELKDAPPGFSLNGARVPAGEDKVRATLSASSSATKEPLRLAVQGRALIEGREVLREAVPAEDMMQAFAYRHLVPADELDVAVLGGRFMPRTQARIYSQLPVRIPAGGSASVEVGMATSTFFANVDLELSEPPDGISIEKIRPVRNGTEIVLRSDAAKVKPGLKGNLIVNSYFAGDPRGDKGKKKLDKRFTSVGSLPAIPFEIVAK